MSFKFETNLRPFDGSGSWSLWYERFETIALFSKWEDDKDKARYLSIYLEGIPLRIYQQLPAESRSSCKAIAERMNTAFQPSPQEAHALLLKRRWQVGQSAEELFYDLLTLWKLSLSSHCDKLSEGAQTAAVVPFFYSALPAEVSRQLRLLEIPLDNADKLLRHARTLLGCLSEDEGTIGAVQGGRSAYQGGGSSRRGGRRRRGPRVCRNCRSTEHTEDQCRFKEPVCTACFKPGHFSSSCSKNASRVGRSSGPASGARQ